MIVRNTFSSIFKIFILSIIFSGMCLSQLAFSQIALTQKINISSNSKATPSISVSKTSLDFEKVYTGFYSLPQSYTVSASDLTDNLIITAPTCIEISTSCASDYSASLQFSPIGGSVSVTIFARYTAGSVSGEITHESNGAVTKAITISETESSTNLALDYYSTATGTGATLKTNLYNIIKDHNSLDYDELITAYETTDIKPDGYVWDVYSDIPCGTNTINYNFSTDQCGNYSGEGDCYNREHSFPNSWFGGNVSANEASIAYTDLFQVIPSDGYVNGIRSNYVYGEVSSPTYTSVNGSKRGPNVYSPQYTGVVFEPIDEYKGDIARIYFYMITRYEPNLSEWEDITTYGNVVMDGNTYPGFETWFLQMLFDWHTQDPVSQKEKTRNDEAFLIQGNRNPFIDNPEFVSLIWTASPELSTFPSSINSLAYSNGNGPSPAQSFILSGAYLTSFPGDISVAAPANFEISADGILYSNSLLIPYTSSTLSSSTIYVRLAADLENGAYSGSIDISGGGDTDGTSVSLNGIVSSVVVSACLSEDFSGITEGTHASPGSADISSTINLFTQTNGWSGNKIFPAGGEIKLGSSSASGYIITPAVDLSEGGTLSFDYAKYGSDVSVVQVLHASDGVNFSQVGGDITPETGFLTHNVEITDGSAMSKIKISTNTKRAYIDNIEIQCGGSTPTASLNATPNVLNGFSYIEGSGPSAEQHFVISGVDLNGDDVIITPPSDYEISLNSGTNYQNSPLTLSTFTGIATDIYVRLKADLGFGIYNLELITISGGGASDITVTCNGSVDELFVPALIVNPSALIGFNYLEGFGPSVEQSFELSGSNLNETDVTINPTTNYEVSLSSGTVFQSDPVVVSAFDGSPIIVYVRLKSALNIGVYNLEDITISGGGSEDVSVSCSGDVDEFVGFNQEYMSDKIKVFPNPTTDILNISISDWKTNSVNYEITNITGQIIYKSSINVTNGFALESIDCKSLKPSLYYIRFYDDCSSISKKFNKNR